MTTFLIPCGHYRYLRAPMGLSSSSDQWCCYSDCVIEGCEFVKKIVNNILIWAQSLELPESRILKILECCFVRNLSSAWKFLLLAFSFLIKASNLIPRKQLRFLLFLHPKTSDLRFWGGFGQPIGFLSPRFQPPHVQN